MEAINSLLVTGGTGTLGMALLAHLQKIHDITTISIYSRDELKQACLRKKFSDSDVRWIIGDVRDYDRLLTAAHGVDVIIHAAALKRIETSEVNPGEFIKTNVIGSENVVKVADQSNSIKRVVGVSTDKACKPVNLYGATKMCMEKIFCSHSESEVIYTCVRYGNVFGSRGSVVDILKNRSNGISITDPSMTRFWITKADAVKLISDAMSANYNRSIIAPKLPSMQMKQIFSAFEDISYDIVGRGIGEKKHEDLISKEESVRTIDYGAYYVIHDSVVSNRQPIELKNGLNSKDNPMRLSDEEALAWVKAALKQIE